MTFEDLIQAGYKKYTNDGASKLKLADGYFAKMINDHIGKKYQVVIYWYDHSKYPQFNDTTINFMPEVQFRDVNGDFCVNIQYFTRTSTPLQEVEDYYEHMWEESGKLYYEKWEK